MKVKLNYQHNFYTYRKDLFSVIHPIVNSSSDITIIIPNLCGVDKNTSRFFSLINKHYPSVKINLDLLNSPKLGYNQYLICHENPKHKNKIIIVNMFCNEKTKEKNSRKINYRALATSMININSYAKEYLHNNIDQKIQIHSPKFGTGFAGGDWNTIANLIDDIWTKDFDVFIYEPTNV